VRGEGLPAVERLRVSDAADVGRDYYEDADAGAAAPAWLLRGVPSQERYAVRREREELIARQPPLGRPEATYAALIPIRKSAIWWELAQDERRAIFEERSRHIETGMAYLPAVARRLLHSRDLLEPFDFLTWFEYAPAHESAFEELVAHLRSSAEWRYVEREVDVRLER
jgi:chlorite dismutase